MAFLDYTGLSHFLDKLKTIFASKSNTVLDTTLSRGRATGSVVGNASIAFGDGVIASGTSAQAFGHDTQASGYVSYAEGLSTISSGVTSHSEGSYTEASAEASHAEGFGAVASEDYSHAEGYYTIANIPGMHAQGINNHPNLSVDFIEEWDSEKDYYEGDYVHKVTTSGDIRYYMAVVTMTTGDDPEFDTSSPAKWVEVKSIGNVLDVVGNGEINGRIRSNAYALDTSGNGHFQGDVYVNCESDSSGGSKVALEDQIPTVINNLTSTSTVDALSAAQGKALNEHYKIVGSVGNPVTDLDILPLNGTGNVVLDATISPSGVLRSHSFWKSGSSATRWVIFAVDQYTNRFYYQVNYEGTLQGWKSIPTGIVDNLTSTSTTDALSANQGKVLNDTTVKLTGTQTVAGTKTFTDIPRFKNDAENPSVMFQGSDLANQNARLYAYGAGTSNGKYGQPRFAFIEFSPSSDGATRTDYYESYLLPSVDAGRTSNASYSILTSKDNAIYDGLNSTSTTRPLSANQGKVLNEAIQKVSNYTDSGTCANQAAVDTLLTTTLNNMENNSKTVIRFTASASFGIFTSSSAYFVEISRGSVNTYASAMIMGIGGTTTAIGYKDSTGWSYHVIARNDETVSYRAFLPSGTELNGIRTPGMYGLSSRTGASYGSDPGNDAYFLVVFKTSATAVSPVQLAIGIRKVYIRIASSATEWNAWHSIDNYGEGWLPTNTDLNDILLPGTYGLSTSSTYSHGPGSSVGGVMEVFVPSANENYAMQRITTSAGTMYVRYRSNSSGTAWGSWYKFTGSIVS